MDLPLEKFIFHLKRFKSFSSFFEEIPLERDKTHLRKNDASHMSHDERGPGFPPGTTKTASKVTEADWRLKILAISRRGIVLLE